MQTIASAATSIDNSGSAYIDADASSSVFNIPFNSLLSATTNAHSAITETFASAGPMRLGTITFTGNGGCQYGPGTITSNCSGEGNNFVEYFSNLQSATLIPAYCSSHPFVCTTETLPVELGDSFSVEASVGLSAA